MSKQRSTLSKGRNFNAKLVRHCCQKRQQCRNNIRHCSIRQCCFDIVAGVDGALERCERSRALRNVGIDRMYDPAATNTDYRRQPSAEIGFLRARSTEQPSIDRWKFVIEHFQPNSANASFPETTNIIHSMAYQICPKRQSRQLGHCSIGQYTRVFYLLLRPQER